MGVGGFASTRRSLKETITSFDKQLRNAFEQQVREPEIAISEIYRFPA